MQEPPLPTTPLDYRPHSADAKPRRWPVWVGLAAVVLVHPVVLLLLWWAAHSAPRVAPQPVPLFPSVYPSPASQPGFSPGPPAPTISATQPATGQSAE